jgi:hypothetical protein
MRITSRLVLVSAGVAFGCSQGPAAPPFKPMADVKQLMRGAIDAGVGRDQGREQVKRHASWRVTA